MKVVVTFEVEEEFEDQTDESGLTERAWIIVREVVAQVGTEIHIQVA